MRLLAATLLLGLTACAQDTAPTQSETAGPTGEAAADLTPAQQAYKDANDRMHAGMAAVDADPDVAFMQGMLAHHKGAVDMSEVALEHADDPEVRALATAIIAAQGKEITQMEAWLAGRGKQPSASMDDKAAATDPHAGH